MARRKFRKERVFGLLAFCAAMSAGGARAALPATPLAQLGMRAWGLDSGLPHNHVRALGETPDGYLWVGTPDGLARFDGARFSVFRAHDTPGLDVSGVLSLLTDRRGTLWIGLRGGGGLLRRPAGPGAPFVPEPELGGSAVVSSYLDRAGGLWLGHWRGVTHVPAAGAPTTLGDDRVGVGSVFAITGTPDGSLWFGGLYGLTRRHPSGEIERVPLGEGAVQVRALAVDEEGVLWAGSPQFGLFKHDGRSVRRFGRESGLPDEAVVALLADRHGGLWIGTDRGLARHHQGRFETHPLTAAPDDHVVALHEDREGSLWVGTRSGGLVRLVDSALVTVHLPAPVSREPTTAVHAAPDGAVWIASRDGLVRHKDGRMQVFTRKDGLCASAIWAMETDARGHLWLGGLGGDESNLCRFDGHRFHRYGDAHGLTREDHVRTLYRDPDGVMWVGSHRLFRVDGDTFTLVTSERTHVRTPIFATHRDRTGIFWLGTGRGLVAGTDPGARVFGAADGMSDRAVYAIHEGERPGDLWLATRRGLTRRRDGRFFAYRANNGLFDDPVYSVFDDGRGQLWMCTPRGLARVRTADLDAVDRGVRPTLSYARYGAADGTEGQGCEGGEGHATAARDASGRLWFASGRGVLRMDPSAWRAPATPLNVVIERVVVDGRDLHPDARVSLPPGRRDLEIHYAAPALRSPQRIRVRHRLVPFDVDWIENRSAKYTRLPPGPQRFEVEAYHEDAPHAVARASMALDFAPRWWERRLFGLAVAGAVAAAGALAGVSLQRRRVRRVRDRHAVILAERTRIAREIHDTLAQGFTGISIQLAAAAKKLSGLSDACASDARVNLEQARKLAQSSLDEARRAVHDLRVSAEDAGLVPALQRIARELGLEVTIDVQVEGATRPLPSAHEAALVRIGQEALTNALKHGEPRRIQVLVTFQPRAVALRVRDDGRGMRPGPAPAGSTGFGLRGMRERAELLGGRLELCSAPGSGTEVAVTVPLPPT